MYQCSLSWLGGREKKYAFIRKQNACLLNLPVAVPPDSVDKVTTTFLPRVPFRIDAVTITLPVSSSTEYVARSNPIVTTADENSVIQYMENTLYTA